MPHLAGPSPVRESPQPAVLGLVGLCGVLKDPGEVAALWPVAARG
ncbi:hypothetical protein [Streptomyces sp. TRM68367]|nr:hypothetical protein [Streptomyces sp. TRM68367]